MKYFKFKDYTKNSISFLEISSLIIRYMIEMIGYNDINNTMIIRKSPIFFYIDHNNKEFQISEEEYNMVFGEFTRDIKLNKIEANTKDHQKKEIIELSRRGCKKSEVIDDPLYGLEL